MEEKKLVPLRTLEQVNQEYSQVATLYGDRLFKITFLQNEVKELFEKMATLNQEAGALQGIPPVVQGQSEPILAPPPAKLADAKMVKRAAAKLAAAGAEKKST